MFQFADGYPGSVIQSSIVESGEITSLEDAEVTAQDAGEDGVSSAEGGKMDTPVEEQQELSALEKYWKAVKDNPGDFTGWTYLLQYVEQEV